MVAVQLHCLTLNASLCHRPWLYFVTLAAHQGVSIKSEADWLILWVVKEVAALATTHLLKFLGWAHSCIIPSKLSHGHPNLLSNFKKEAGSLSSAVTTYKSDDPNQAFDAYSSVSFISTIFYMHQIPYQTPWFIAYWDACCYLILLSNTMPPWHTTASITISETTPPSSFISFLEDVCIVLLVTERHLIHPLLFRRSHIKWSKKAANVVDRVQPQSWIY